jgi:hypothetical protein
VANSGERLHSILATLEQCRTALTKEARPETAKLVSLAILQLRMDINQVADRELKALCDALAPDDEFAEMSQDSKVPHGQRRRPPAALKLVK